MLLEYKAVDHILIGLIETYKQRIMEAGNQTEVLEFFKFDLMKESLEGENIGCFINSESLKSLIGDGI